MSYETGWFIEDGELVEVKGEQECLERANGRQVWWQYEKAAEALFRQNEPIEAAYQDFIDERITLRDFQATVGEIAALNRIREGKQT